MGYLALKNISKGKRSGFTIVELLIVIVVIAILAAITLVAYNGITTRATNTQVVAGVQEYYNAILQYNAVTGSYPDTGGCLGSGYPNNQCWVGTDGTYTPSPTLDAEIATVMPNKPTLATSLFSIGNNIDMRAGALYQTNNGSPQIIYYLKGAGQTCSVANSTAVTEGNVVTQCALKLP